MKTQQNIQPTDDITRDTLPPLLTMADMCELFQVSQVTIHRWAKAGTIPAPRRFGKRSIRWLREDIEHLLSRD